MKSTIGLGFTLLFINENFQGISDTVWYTDHTTFTVINFIEVILI